MGEQATLIHLGDDYDGGHKAWVRWPDGSRRHRARLAGPARLAAHSCPTTTRSRPRASRGRPRVGRLAAGQAVRQFGTRAANLARSDEKAQAALDRRQVQTAEQIVAVLGTMKGAAMKLGQVMSFLDVGLVPEEFREEFQEKLAALRDAAPKVSFQQMKKVIEDEYDEPVDEVFETFDPVPIAAASIGQVYKARLPDGRDVAVKVQYPGVASAVRADMQNLGMILRLMKRIAPGLDPQALGDEIRARIDEELDYELEAANQRTLARDLPRPPVHRRARRRHAAVARAGGRVGVRHRPRLRGDQAAARRPSATGSARSSSASTSAACTATTSSAATRTRATRCCSTTGGWRSWTSACSSGSRRRSREFELDVQRLGGEGRARRADRAPAPRRLHRRPVVLHAGQDHGPVPGPDLVVHDRRGGPADARDRHARCSSR